MITVYKQVLPPEIVGFLLGFARQTMASRPPDFLVGPDAAPYLQRWMTQPKNANGNAYVHRFLLDDDNRAEHDHPADNISMVLDVGYREVVRGILSEPRLPGDVVFRSGDEPHRVVLIDGPSTSLFLHGERYREWGFHCPQSWRPWFTFLGRDPKASSGGAQDTGRGCE